MNERIKELAEQAGFYSSEYGNAEGSFIKFAELIVKECIKEIGHKSVDLLDVDLFPHYQERLKKHFGVKE